MKSLHRVVDCIKIKSIEVVNYVIEIADRNEEEVYQSNITVVVKILKDNWTIKTVRLIEQNLTVGYNYDKISKKFAEKFIAKNELGKMAPNPFLKLLRLS